MKVIRHLAITAIFWFMPVVHSIESCKDFMPEYYTGVDRIIDAAVGRPARLSFTTFPSFNSESGVRLVGADVYFVSFGSSFWDQANVTDKSRVGGLDFTKPRVKATTTKAPLRADLVERVEGIFAKAIADARPANAVGVDGVTYRFAVPKAGCGEVWSPPLNSTDGHLVILGELLEMHARLKNTVELRKSEKAIEGATKNAGGN